MAKFTLQVKANQPHFQYHPRLSQNACLVQIRLFKLKSVTSYCADKPNIPAFWDKIAKMNLNVKINNPHFQYEPRVS